MNPWRSRASVVTTFSYYRHASFRYFIPHKEDRASLYNSITTHMERMIKYEDVNLDKTELLKPVQCKVCLKAYTNKYRLGLHMDSKHDEVRYPCDQCGYEATQKTSLIIHHNALHANVKFQCDKCEYKATQKSSLKTHEDSIHTSIKFACDQC